MTPVSFKVQILKLFKYILIVIIHQLSVEKVEGRMERKNQIIKLFGQCG